MNWSTAHAPFLSIRLCNGKSLNFFLLIKYQSCNQHGRRMSIILIE